MMTMISTTTSATIPTIGANVKGRRQRRLIIIITLFVSFVLLLAGVGLSFTSSPLSPFAFGKEEAKIKGLLGADDAGFLNPDEEESTKVSVEDEVEVHGKNEEEEEEEEENATGELLGVGDQEEGCLLYTSDAADE